VGDDWWITIETEVYIKGNILWIGIIINIVKFDDNGKNRKPMFYMWKPIMRRVVRSQEVDIYLIWQPFKTESRLSTWNRQDKE
jgi:hypothetical protein